MNHSSIILLSGLSALLVTTAGCSHPPAPPAKTAAPAETAPAVAWQDWSKAAFDQAVAEDKLVLVDVGIEGCTACRRMYEITYADEAVRARMAQHFVAVAVDADARPDLGQRYVAWGWPATIVLTPTGKRLKAIRGNKMPQNFIPILDDLIAAKANTKALPNRDRPVAQGASPDSDLGQSCARVVAALDESADPVHGGWGFESFRGVRGGPVAHAFLRGRARGEKARTDLALLTAQKTALLTDPVWGGTFVGSFTDDWRSPVPEKRTKYQAAVIHNFAWAHRVTDDPVWLDHAYAQVRYLQDWMRAADGTYYVTQEDDAPALPAMMSAQDYYQLDDAARREYGIPPIDHGVYTDVNGRVIHAFAALYEAGGSASVLALAEQAADVLLNVRLTQSGFMRQVTPTDELQDDERMRRLATGEGNYLRAQVHFVRGLLSLYRVTGEPRWLDAAETIVKAMRRDLEDTTQGGFFAGPADDTEAIVGRRKPTEDNAVAAQVLLELYALRHDEELKQSALATLALVGRPEVVRRSGATALAEAALAFEWATLGAIEVSLAGPPTQPGAQALLQAARQAFDPRKVVRLDNEGKYPVGKEAALFICDVSACSSPVIAPEKVAGVMARFAQAPSDAPCATLSNP